LDEYLSEFEKLNEYQKNAVSSEEKYVLLNAAVGSGKTTVLVHRVLYLHLLKKVPLEDMIVLTFTNKATEEMKSRILAFGEEFQGQMKYFGTFHSIARLILCENLNLEVLGYKCDFNVLDNEEASRMLTDIIENDNLKIKYRSKLIKRVDEFKNGKALYGVMKKNDDIDELVALYKNEKIKRNVMDFDDIIENCVNVLKEPLNPRYIIVDEFQDTDYKQLELIRKIAGVDTSIFCIGDPNQIIYSWRSGTNNIFNEFKKAFKPIELSLPLNYRSTKTIIEAANSFLYGTSIETTKDYGSLIKVIRHHDAFNEANYLAEKIKKIKLEGIQLRQIAILYRRQAQLEVLLSVFGKEDIPCRVLSKNPIIFENGAGMGEDGEGVNLLTLHASKGLEFNYVFIIGANMGNIPITGRKADEPEEMRLFYVGITRARDHLEISYLAKPGFQGVVGYISPYISMIPERLLSVEENKVGNKLSTLMDMIREERARKETIKSCQVKHSKYGIGSIIFEDEEIIKVDFNIYGEKEFSKMFCPLEYL
jgi:superfamily I DNA/RNA helicase